MASSKTDQSYAQIATKIIEQLKDGTAPWVRPWNKVPDAPFNPVSGTKYKGINTLSLSCEGRSDPRWMTYKQAASKEYQVRKGEKGTPIVFWQFHSEQGKKDSNGRPVRDSKGKPVKEIIRLSRPRLYRSTVFNAEQIDGVPPLPEPEKLDKFEIHERVESILKESGADISHGGQRAFYQRSTDKIQLPEREQFKSESQYYAVALHELGHWTGHDSRLDRDLGNAFGTPEYAREELRAEIASFMLSSELSLPHDPSNHISYIDTWVKVLEDDPSEIFKASRDAEDIKGYTMQYDRVQEQMLEIIQEHRDGWEEYKQIYAEKYGNGLGEKNEPSQEAFQSKDEIREPAVSRDIDLTRDLKDACEKQGLVMSSDPIIDGRFHRVPVERDDGKQNQDGSYKAFSDGRPAGIIINHYTGSKAKWISNASKPLTVDERRKIKAQSTKNKAIRAAADQKRYEHKAMRVKTLLSVMPKAGDDNPYLALKGIKASDGVYQDKRENLVVPITDVNGKPQSLVRIGKTGKFKSYMKGAKKVGGMHVIGDLKSSKDVLVCEGYSTGKTLNESTGLPVAVAFDASNLASVALAVQQAYTKATVFVAGDDDRENDRNIGRVSATDAARAVKSSAIFPYFQKGVKGSDFNDMKMQLQKTMGRNAADHAVRSQIATGIRKGRGAEKHQNKNLSAIRQPETASRSR